MMSLDEAIMHAQEKAEELEGLVRRTRALTFRPGISYDTRQARMYEIQADEYRQLAKWLMELKGSQETNHTYYHTGYQQALHDARIEIEQAMREDYLSNVTPYKRCLNILAGVALRARATRREAKHD